jgi:hypothetical protein
MRLFDFFPWRRLIRRIAHRKGFLDPLELLARLRRFAQPSEVQEPIELIRAGMVFHARGLVNTKVIQHNLDWVWPYWIVRQFSPGDASFIPRAFSFSHVNLTHRNWTAVGVPGCLELPIVDPRGMVTPHHDDWSVDHWFIPDEGKGLFPSRTEEAGQRLLMEGGHAVETRLDSPAARMVLRTEVHWRDGEAVLETEAVVEARRPGRFVIAVRPCNPEGIQFVEEVGFTDEGHRLKVGKFQQVEFERKPDELFTSNYETGDVLQAVLARKTSTHRECEAGLGTAAAAYRIEGGRTVLHRYSIPLIEEEPGPLPLVRPDRAQPESWESYMQDWSMLQVPDRRFVELYESSKRTLALLSQGDILPGPYTYRRFWFRDACIIGNALLGLCQDRIVRNSLQYFHHRQHLDGYFHSQEGEWDSNGQVLWLANQYEEVTATSGQSLATHSLYKAAKWIDRKRARTAHAAAPYRGLLPPGFSAEHLGPNDYYYWDDFWGAAGLRSAAALLERRGEADKASEVRQMAERFEQDIQRSLATLDPSKTGNAIPAAPKRRMDSGAIGSMVADYPLNLSWISHDSIRATADWLVSHSFHNGGFFQNMIHSGINAYLTLDLAQTYLRLGDARYWDLIRATAEIASPTGKWPEAVHPNTLGGCMGDGEHAWAAAEWCQMMRALFVDDAGDVLELAKGIPEDWLQQESPLAFGPTLTKWGRIRVKMVRRNGKWDINLEAEWHSSPPELKNCLPGEFSGKLTIL